MSILHSFLFIRLAFFVCFLVVPFSVQSEDWPQWRGVERDGNWDVTGIIDRFPDEGPRLRWVASLGSGYSGPSVAKGKVFVMDRLVKPLDSDGAKLLHEGKPPRNINFVRKLLPGSERIVCLNEKDGSLLWSYKWDCDYTSVAAYAIGPRVTPTVDDSRVYSLGAEGNLFCHNVNNGEVIWSRDFKKDYALKTPEWGVSAHPLVYENKLICVVGGEGSTVVAFDKYNGKELWKSLSAKQPGYCPPVVHVIGGKRQLLIWHSDAIEALNPSTGSVHWTVPIKSTFAMSIGQPVVSGNRIFIMSYNRVSACIEVAENGESAKVAWKGTSRRGIAGVHNTPMIVDDYIYGCSYGGRYICARLSDGEQLWSTFSPFKRERPISWGNVFTVKQGGRYFLANDLGELIIAKLQPSGYQEISRAKLIEPTHKVSGRMLVWSHPAFANRSVYLRNDNEIRCYDLSKQ